MPKNLQLSLLSDVIGEILISMEANPCSAQSLTNGVEQMVHQALSLGKAAHEIVETNPDEHESLGEAYFFTFEMPNDLKRLLLFWRDTLLSLRKYEVKLSYESIEAGQLEQWLLSASKLIKERTLDFSHMYARNVAEYEKITSVKAPLLSPYRHQECPWGVFEKQLSKIGDQVKNINESYLQLSLTDSRVTEIKKDFESFFINCQTRFSVLNAGIAGFWEAFQSPNDEWATKVEGLVQDLQIEDESLLQKLRKTVNPKIDALIPLIKVPVLSKEGDLFFREEPIQSKVNDWLEAEIHPTLFEYWDYTSQSTDFLKMGVLNIKNLFLASQNLGHPTVPSKQSVINVLQRYDDKLAQAQRSTAQLHKFIVKQLNTSFSMTHFLEIDKPFLPLPFQTTLRQFQLKNAPWLDKLRTWWSHSHKEVTTWGNQVKKLGKESPAEKLTQYISERREHADCQAYTSIFQTNGYVGESFCVGRKDEIARIQKVVEHWKNGFRGTVCLYGDRFSGKTLLGEMVANRFFKEKVIRVRPNEGVFWKEKIHFPKHNLEEALAFIAESTDQEPLMLWIDDIELWRQDGTSLLQNVRALEQFIDRYGHRFFVVVSLNEVLYAKLCRVLDWSRYFQAEVDVDNMTVAEVSEAIIVRHGATHATLTDENGEQVQTQQLKHWAAEVYDRTQGNIGDALRYWSSAIFPDGDINVRFNLPTLKALPDFINEDMAIVLSTVMVKKQVEERHLRTMFGPAYDTVYQPIVYRLLLMGVLSKEVNGDIYITASIVNEIGRWLDHEAYVQSLAI